MGAWTQSGPAANKLRDLEREVPPQPPGLCFPPCQMRTTSQTQSGVDPKEQEAVKTGGAGGRRVRSLLRP